MSNSNNFRLFTVLLIFFSISDLNAQDNKSASGDSLDVFEKLIMERITVVGSPAWMSRIPGAANYVGFEQLQKQNYTDINRVLRNVSGVNLQEEDGFGLRPNIGLRGAGMERSTKINIMEDGVLIAPAPYSAPAAYYFPNVGRMSSVEVRKGSSQIKYGPNSTGGAINLISTRIPYELSGAAEISAGQNNAGKLYANIGNSGNNWGFVLEGLQLRNDGFKNLDGGGNTGFNIKDFMGKFMVRTNTNASVYQRLELKAGYYDEVSDETYVGLTREDFHENPFRRYAGSQADQMNAEHVQLMARHFVQFSDKLDLTTTLYRNNFKRDWYKLQTVSGSGLAGVLANPDANAQSLEFLRGATSPDDALVVRSNNREYYSQGIESIFSVNFDSASIENQLEFGIRLHYDEEDRYQYEDGYRMQDGQMILTSTGTPGTQANRIGSATALSIYVQDKIRFGNWRITPGLRLENIWFENRDFGSGDLDRSGADIHQNEYTIQVFVPGIGATYEISDNFTWIAGIHKGFSPPSPGSGSETRAEESINYEFGFRYSNDLLQSEFIGFYNDYNNLLGSDLAAGGGGGTTAQFNAGEVKVFGLEAAANLDLADIFDVFSSLPLNLNYTFTNATFQSSFESDFGPWGAVQSGDALPFIPEHQFNAGLGFDYESLSLNLNAFTTSRMRTVAGSGNILEEYSTDNYFLLDASSSYQFTSAMNIFVNVRNLLNKNYIVSDRPAGVRPGLPRTIMGGLRVVL